MSEIRSIPQKVTRALGFSVGESLTIAAVCMGLAFAYATMIFFNNKYMADYLASLQPASSFSDNYDQIYLMINNNELFADIAVFTVWLVAGLAIYALVGVLAIFERSIFRFFKTLTYVRTDGSLPVQHSVMQLLVRTGSIAGLLWGSLYFVQSIVPYILASLQVTALNTAGNEVASILLALLVIVICLHVGVILLRGAALRERLLGDS